MLLINSKKNKENYFILLKINKKIWHLPYMKMKK
jgi:hypothetical protein